MCHIKNCLTTTLCYNKCTFYGWNFCDPCPGEHCIRYCVIVKYVTTSFQCNLFIGRFVNSACCGLDITCLLSVVFVFRSWLWWDQRGTILHATWSCRICRQNPRDYGKTVVNHWLASLKTTEHYLLSMSLMVFLYKIWWFSLVIWKWKSHSWEGIWSETTCVLFGTWFCCSTL